MRDARLIPLTFLAAAVAIGAWETVGAQRTGGRDGVFPEALELATTVTDGFTIASVGDLIIASRSRRTRTPRSRASSI